MEASSRIAALEEVPTDTTYLFRLRDVDGGGPASGDGRGPTSNDGGSSTPSDGGGPTSSDGGDETRREIREAILVRHDGTGTDEGVSGWLNACQHFTHVPLDKGSGATMRDDEIVCENHGAYFEADTGYCTFGPCEGAVLPTVDVTVRDGDVYLTDDDYEVVGVGPIEGDDDRSSDSNVEF